jgi:hypothetical protein
MSILRPLISVAVCAVLLGRADAASDLLLLGTGTLPLAQFCPGASTFDGRNDFTTRGAGLNGAADGRQGIFSIWIKFNGGDGAQQNIFMSKGGWLEIRRSSANQFQVFVFNTAFTRTLGYRSKRTVTADGNWHHLLMAWDTNFAAGSKKHQLYIDDVSDDAGANDVAAAFDIDYTDTGWEFGARAPSSSKLSADVAEAYFAATFLDMTTTSNRRKFNDGAGHPVDLGVTCDKPTGSQPIVCFKGPETAWATNSGNGGNFSVTGALTDPGFGPPC